MALIQLINVQYRAAPSLRSAPGNPRNAIKTYGNARGAILAANGTLLAEWVRAPKGSGPYQYVRTYPEAAASLFSGMTGWDSIY